MGSCHTKYPGLTEDVLEDYATLTYLNQGEILYLMKKFYSIDPSKINLNFHHRFHKDDIIKKFHVLKCGIDHPSICLATHRGEDRINWSLLTRPLAGVRELCRNLTMQEFTTLPFPTAIMMMSCSNQRNNPFQDRLFHVFSSQKDDSFSFEDLIDLCSAMSPECPAEVKAVWAFRVYDIDGDNQISAKDINDILDRLTWAPNNRLNNFDNTSKVKISEKILKETNLDTSGSIGLSEFKLIVSRLPEFATSFYFRL